MLIKAIHSRAVSNVLFAFSCLIHINVAVVSMFIDSCQNLIIYSSNYLWPI